MADFFNKQLRAGRGMLGRAPQYSNRAPRFGQLDRQALQGAGADLMVKQMRRGSGDHIAFEQQAAY